MLLKHRNAVVYGGGGSMGGAVARAFAREGATVFLAGRTLSKLDGAVKEIRAADGRAEAAELDAFDQKAVEAHLDEMTEKAGSIDVSFNTIGITAVQGTPLVDMSVKDFLAPITEAAHTHFVTATAAARRMTAQGWGHRHALVLSGSRVAASHGWVQPRLRVHRSVHTQPRR